jgi:hypothetical protein
MQSENCKVQNGGRTEKRSDKSGRLLCIFHFSLLTLHWT